MKKHQFTIRKLGRQGDEALIVELHRRGYAAHGPRFAGAFADYVAETVAEASLSDSNGSQVWFAERDGHVVGCAALVNRGDRGQLRWVVVLPSERGNGFGRALVRLAIDASRAANHSEIYLETTDGLVASMALYKRLGFRTISKDVQTLWGNNIGQHIVMALTLR